jgi:hypothetical protein
MEYGCLYTREKYYILNFCYGKELTIIGSACWDGTPFFLVCVLI